MANKIKLEKSPKMKLPKPVSAIKLPKLQKVKLPSAVRTRGSGGGKKGY